MITIKHLIIEKLSVLFFLSLALITACETAEKVDIKTRAKFEPENGKCLVFIGQDMDAIGGVEGYSDGYCNHFDIPAGITVYTNFSLESGNHGIFSKSNWGSGDCYADKQINAPGFENTVLAIGLSIVNSEKAIVNGELDAVMAELGEWIKSLSPRPVFLRIGYEFDGHSWNHYDQNYYTKAWHYIVDRYDQMGIENIAFVWQSKGAGTSVAEMETWYPGDRYVDWCGYSYFSHPDTEMITFARKHKKPVFIAELTPCFQEGDSIFYDTDMDHPETAEKIWDEWMTNFFSLINENSDVIKAFSYINVDWPSQAMWINNPYFNQVDSRIQQSEYVSKNWLNEISSERYLKPDKDLFSILWNNK
ncbi:MAG: glycoside hydrolase family 26 protein [Prolixibacteraceae bacterium]